MYHRSIVPVAAFDPIFWFHHANIDRLIALWQAVYPDTYVEPTQQRASTFTIQMGSIQDQDSRKSPSIISQYSHANTTKL